MQLILTDNSKDWQNLLPLTFTKPISALRIGILTIAEKWQKHLQIQENQIYYLTESYLQSKFIVNPKTINLSSLKDLSNSLYLYVNSSINPDEDLIKIIKNLPENAILFAKEVIIAIKTSQYFVSANEIGRAHV